MKINGVVLCFVLILSAMSVVISQEDSDVISCGDGICSPNEDKISCPIDCGMDEVISESENFEDTGFFSSLAFKIIIIAIVIIIIGIIVFIIYRKRKISNQMSEENLSE